jgi:hypothetical protein
MIHEESNRLSRREVIQGTRAIMIANLVAPLTTGEAATTPFESTSASRDSAPLGRRIRGFQHFGMTVQNMDRAFEFYTEILGGTEIMRDGDFHGKKIHNTLMLNDEIEAFEQKINPVTIGVPDLRFALTHPQSLAKLPTSRFVGNDPRILIRSVTGWRTIHELVCFPITIAAAGHSDSRGHD